MDNPEPMKSFVRQLQRFENSGRLQAEDWEVIPRLSHVVEPNRIEHPVPSENERPASLHDYFRSQPADTYKSMKEGLKKTGWSEMPYVKQDLGKGFFGRVFLAFRVSDPRPLESKQLIAVKVQKLAENNQYEFGVRSLLSGHVSIPTS